MIDITKERERLELQKQFWGLIDPSIEGYSKAISRLLDSVSMEDLRQIVKDMKS